MLSIGQKLKANSSAGLNQQKKKKIPSYDIHTAAVRIPLWSLSTMDGKLFLKSSDLPRRHLVRFSGIENVPILKHMNSCSFHYETYEKFLALATVDE